MSGAKIQTSILLPVDTLLQIDFKLKTLEQQITAMGKVKWLKVLIEDKSYEAGVEFIDTPSDAIKKIDFYISQITRLHRTDLTGYWVIRHVFVFKNFFFSIYWLHYVLL